MKIEDRKAAMIAAIRSVSPAGKERDAYILELADKLESLGAFIPPVKVGETVYAACPKLCACDEDIIDEYKVRGVGVDDEGDIFVIDAGADINHVGDMYCNLTREDAEVWLKRYKEQHGDNGSEGDEDDGE